jgi:flagellar capping protein FliD
MNQRNTGVAASVQFNQQAGTSQLVLESRETGANQGFSVLGASGSAAQTLGINNVTQEAQNAQFRVNRGFTGALQTSSSNEVSLGLGLSAELRETGTTEVTMSRNETRQINAFRHLVNSFNDLLANSRESLGSNSALERELSSVARSSSASLRRLGISVGNDGRMSIDERQMQKAAERGDLERFAERDRIGGNTGFMNRLSRVSENASRNPNSFARNDNTLNMGGIQFSQMQMAQINRSLGMGMLFETML